ncbi:hypothetical protein NQ318_020003 [Aromia moschata]|uniref:Uncharacterized protein n=1 Tax=Aromia moschata TaxID=1265417 RepID=A0AAV8Z982_9CUCU|nr:hypothetical protein NQ318_020003 [Aromia moschata]
MKCGGSRLKELIVPIVLSVQFAVIHLYCLLTYHTQVTDKDLLHFAYVGYTTMFLNSLVNFTSFGTDESFCELRLLLDYAQLTLALPCFTTEVWIANSVGANEVAVLHALFGLSAFFFYVLMEYKRQDLTDLALIISGLSSLLVGLIYANYFASGAALVYLVGYFFVKRKQTCGLEASGAYNYIMAANQIALEENQNGS